MANITNFFGNAHLVHTLTKAIEDGRIPQTVLLSGPEGVGKATLARRFAAALLGDAEKIEHDDLSSAANLDVLAERDKWTSEKRADDPLLFSSHPDFVTFAPDGPLRQLTIQQMRTFRERAQYKPLRGNHRVFLIDHLDRANEQSANSLLKVLEEPPEHLVIFATTENLYDLLPTIRSRSIVLQMNRLTDEDVRSFATARNLPDAETRVALSQGCPGIAATLDLQQFRDRRALMLTAFECGCRLAPFSAWVQASEPFSVKKSEKLESYLRVGYGLLNDILRMRENAPSVSNRDIRDRLEAISRRVTFAWIEQAVRQIDELAVMVRRNIQKTAALDALIIELRSRNCEPV